MKFSVIIPVWNLAERGYGRVINMLYSLSLQSFSASQFDVWVVDGSREALQLHLAKLIDTLPESSMRVHHFRVPKMIVFNKPILVNLGMKVSKAEYFICTDADYLYSRDMLSILNRNVSETKYLLHKVRMLPRSCKIDFDRIKQWQFETYPENEFGQLADGGCQVFRRSWFETCGGYDERMQGWCGMDNDMTNRATRAGLNVEWVDEGSIFHQWHKIEKHRTRSDIRQSEKNWYIRDNDHTIKRN